MVAVKRVIDAKSQVFKEFIGPPKASFYQMYSLNYDLFSIGPRDNLQKYNIKKITLWENNKIKFGFFRYMINNSWFMIKNYCDSVA